MGSKKKLIQSEFTFKEIELLLDSLYGDFDNLVREYVEKIDDKTDDMFIFDNTYKFWQSKMICLINLQRKLEAIREKINE